jgi:hypothetical protein
LLRRLATVGSGGHLFLEPQVQVREAASSFMEEVVPLTKLASE